MREGESAEGGASGASAMARRMGMHGEVRGMRIGEHARARRAEEMCVLAELLRPDERELVRARYGEGRSAKRIAVLTGAPEHVVRRRLMRLRTRLAGPAFAFWGARLEELEGERRAVARACFLEGRSIRAAALDLGMSRHAVREMRGALLVLARGAGRREVRVRG